jgi:DNA polymerase-3 subunit gamma/tau
MNNLVLYRKYRPQTFGEIIGQEHVVKTLSNALASGRVSHAYLFSGPRGTGKTTIARVLAKSLNCLNRKPDEFEPCNKCSSCSEIGEGRSIDLIEIDAASHRGIDEIKELISGIQFTPSQSRYKVFIIDECHQLSKEAANALLKTLEEPPAHAIFILATTEIHKMIPTIISRCQRFDFRKLTVAEIIRRLELIAKAENVRIEKPALEMIALNSSGSMRDAESLFGQILTFQDVFGNKEEIKAEKVKDLLGLVEINLISQFVEFLFNKKVLETIKYLNEINESGYDLQEFAKGLINYLRQALIIRFSGDSAAEGGNPIVSGLTKEELEKLKKRAVIFKEEELKNILNLFMDAENKMRYASIPQLPLELAIIEAIGPRE